MPMSGRQKMKMIFGDRLGIHQAMTPDLAALYPFFHESGLIHPETGRKLPGIRRGWAGKDRSGGVFDWEPRVCQNAGLTTDMNVMWMGRIGRGKSAGTKKFIRRAIPWGNRFIVTDVKGEYGPLCEAVGGIELKFGGDTKYYMNPLDPKLLGKDRDIRMQLDLIMSLALTLMDSNRTTMDIRQKTALEWAIKDLHEHYGTGSNGLSSDVPILEGLVEKLMRPTDNMLEKLGRVNEYDFVREITYDIGLALDQLTRGSLKGMFDQKTSEGMYEDTHLLVFNLADLDDVALRLVARTHNFLTSSQYGKATGAGRFNYIVHDETWKLVTDPHFVQSVVQSFKLGRTKDVCNMIIFHHLFSLIRSGHNELISELIGDTSTIISYTQKKAEIEATAELLGFNESAVRQIPKLQKYHCLTKVGELSPILVEDVHWKGDAEIVETSHLLKGHTEEWWEEEIDRQVEEALGLAA
jgi:hypothetical protein